MARGRFLRRVGLIAYLVAIGLVASSALMPVVAAPAPAPVALDAPAPPQINYRSTAAVASWPQLEAASFRVELDTHPDFASPRVVSVADDLAVLSELTPATTYYVRVSAVGADGGRSVPSRTTAFTTEPAPFPLSPPRLLAPESQTSTSLSLSWTSAAKKKQSYQAELATNPQFEEATSQTTTERQVEFTGLKTTTVYYARVRAVGPSGAALSGWSRVVSGHPASELPLRVATYNVLKASAANWTSRRKAVAAAIQAQDLDVIGVQEAQNKAAGGASTQYRDLLRLLGGRWTLTTNSRHTTGDIRTLYDASRVTLVSEGYHRLSGSRAFGGQRYVAWAIFSQKSTGKRFLHVNTHLVWQRSGKANAARASEAAQLVAAVRKANRDRLPVIIGGDFNTHERRTAGNAVYRTITGAGYLDPLAETEGVGAAEKLVNAELQTYNAHKRTADRSRSARTTTMIDHIFVSKMRVAEWETVARLDASGRFVGTIPSDHNMVRVTVYLP